MARMSRLRAALATCALVVVPLLAGCGGAGGDGGDNGDEAIEVGRSFTYEGYQVEDGWTLEKVERDVAMETMTQAEVRGEVTNTNDQAGYALFELVFARQGDEVATVRCSSSKLAPDETGELLCPGFGSSYPEDYDTIVAQAIRR
jgi:hypothetical protein